MPNQSQIATSENRQSRRPTTSRPASGQGADTADSSSLRRAKDLGAELLAQGKLKAALSTFQEVVNAAPGEPLYRQKVAEILQRLGRTEEAIAEYETAVWDWARAGWLLRAIALCKVILQLEPGHLRTQALLAQLYGRREHPRSREVRQGPGAAVPPGLVTRHAKKVPAASGLGAPMPPIPIFSALGREVFREVLGGVERRVCQPGEVIVREGAPGNSMFIIVEGQVNVVRQGRAERPMTLASLGDGEFFGEMALLYEGPRLSSVVAATEAVLLEFSRERMEAIAARYPQMKEVVERLFRQRLLANVLRSNPLFAGWPEALQQAVSEAFLPLAVQEGEELLRRGQPSQALYLLLRGRCAVFHQHVDGHETPYPELEEGAVFGEISLFRSRLATASVRASTSCVLLKLDPAALERLLPHHPMLHKELQRLGAERMLRTHLLLAGRPPRV
ncbi:cyclic nucleotide-binding domain-containing protein [Stigmatella erecta]|uniref:Cyclic nucleotide-binding domain-containing protein n=1 Tax=Stigmatella erecta TaxID=83460 RepID=A0A1H9YR90_9BACT|nr:cyclic nucleotide-binding domain-containing protein [Stigmatella erecta]SES71568.1 Cyclic nucleotide-binding domain-containing protein [Stigmatella erecta]